MKEGENERPVEQHYAGHRASPPHNGPPHHPVIKYTKLTHACNEQLLVGKPKMCSMGGSMWYRQHTKSKPKRRKANEA